ncbi:RNA-directed DNA polymerase [Pseudomonas sp. CFBP13509]|uniref:reverse transcriptase family protein n=1 Tax=Pseudomonas sp. CFBP13509 TaxID=2184008 RepID=UPI0010BFB001|nr:reverse transcriptase family protein [Pseudomonas sp. CFBP13509]TKJ80260.1 RNA-directed DNA polymerase [Pseudomonas sp. CFBP13509]
MTVWRPQHFRKNGLKAGADKAVIANAIEYGKAIVRCDSALTPVFTLRHLAALSGTTYEVLREIVGRQEVVGKEQPYRIFRIRKRKPRPDGAERFRTICIPSPMLMRVQRYIHDHILTHLAAHPASIAYNDGKKIVDEVAIHCGCKWLIKVDIKNFFEAIPEQSVYRVFRGAGYPALVSFEMARLCTRVVPLNWTEGPRGDSQNLDSKYSIARYSNRYQGSLPQGSPSSPLLANLCSRRLDDRIEQLAIQHDLVYTRYADDLSLSTDDPEFNRTKASQVIGRLYAILAECGFAPNTMKTAVVPPSGRKILLGLYVDSDRPRLSREFRYKLEQHLHFCLHAGVGPVEHAKRRGFDAVFGFRNHVRGLVAYAVQIDPDYGAKRLAEFHKVAWPF